MSTDLRSPQKQVENRDVHILNCRRFGFATCVVTLLSVLPAFSQVAKSGRTQRSIVGLPAGAVVVEVEPLPLTAHADRILVLWMQSPAKHPREMDGEAYTCPERTRGSYYSGPTRISLVNTQSGEIINTVRVTIRSVTESAGNRKEREDDRFDIPYLIKRDLYRVDALGRGREGKPKIIDLKDYNADGRALEFALFNAESCSDVAVQLIGYSTSKDQVVQYAFRSVTDRGDEKPWFWADNLFAHKPVSNGHWHYTMTFPGATCVFDYRYRSANEDFLTETSCGQ